ncbi:hypothetical protein [Actinomyces haliotis]|uniref:hypothetical protein n=1 Tax=Actinomyces haliotis TaxID=1280843 RepID=UPI00188F3956|nr:hypothetical protein [Actinomyces haliotis]
MAASLSGTITGPPRYTTIGDSTAAQHRDGGLAAFVGVHLDIREAGLVIDHGVQEAHPEPGLVSGITGSFSVRSRRAVLHALLT